MSTPDLGIERAAILTISTAHLHPATRQYLEDIKGDVPEGPSIALREEGYLVNSHRGLDNPLSLDCMTGLFEPMISRMPDIVLIQALARGLQAEWINIDTDGPVCDGILPSYDDNGFVTLPTADGWKDSLSRMAEATDGHMMVMPAEEVLATIEAGQTPGLHDDAPGMS